jgi:nitroimidazol reductase NimA-like FMN-containing flavoprotein (pyridoxamine 5'-phosphate oxidase superfamily)
MSGQVSDPSGNEAGIDRRGRMHRSERLMADGDARAFLQTGKVAHAGSVDASGWPYVVPLIYIYEGGDRLYLHTGNHGGHFQRSVEARPRVCVEVADIGPVHRGHPFACNSALVYTSVIVFGAVRIIDDRDQKAWFFDRVLEKYGESDWTFAPGYPHLHRIVLYEQQIEVMTGKHSNGLYH